MARRGWDRARHLIAPESAVVVFLAFAVYRVATPVMTLAIGS